MIIPLAPAYSPHDSQFIENLFEPDTLNWTLPGNKALATLCQGFIVIFNWEFMPEILFLNWHYSTTNFCLNMTLPSLTNATW